MRLSQDLRATGRLIVSTAGPKGVLLAAVGSGITSRMEIRSAQPEDTNEM